MEITVSHAPPVHILRLSGRWDAFSAKDFEARTTLMVRNEGMRLVALDLANVDYISSFGLRSLLNLGKLLEPEGGKVFVASLRPIVSKVFLGSGFDSLFPAFDHVDAAVTELMGHA
ncbi:STAS domain-containing protein [Desulfovibrio sp. OttesenSCG-928-I05]|nr:STAS domain-containing protein [Desulfovibrio sp. OttesenSCG-928-I05]